MNLCTFLKANKRKQSNYPGQHSS